MTAPGAASTGLLTTSEVARAFRVRPETVRDWARQGKIPVALRTLGGQKRYKHAEIAALLNGGQPARGGAA